VSVHTCKICKAPQKSFPDLKTHWRSEHTKEYVAVQTWLSDVDEAVIVAECVIQRQEREDHNRHAKVELEYKVLPARPKLEMERYDK
jgi:hypothetical protein